VAKIKMHGANFHSPIYFHGMELLSTGLKKGREAIAEVAY
jgi:hypothetical protein